MKWRGLGIGLAITLGAAQLARIETRGQVPATSAKVDAIALELVEPGRYLTPSVLEPIRRVTLIAPTDGIVRSQAAQLGALVREGSEVAQMDRAEASAHLKIAQAEVKERQAELEAQKATGPGPVPALQARLDAAQGRLDLAQLAFDRCSLRAPFSGKILNAFVSEGQFVTRGTILAELADVTSLKSIIALSRAEAKLGAPVPVLVEGQPASARVHAVLPLPDSMATLRELASPMVAASVVVSNASGELEPGERTHGLTLPDAPVTLIPPSAIHAAESRPKDRTKTASAADAPTVQVIRNEYVTTLKVRVLGPSGPDRVQVTGPFRRNDALIVHSSVPLIPGTLLRFSGGSADAIEATVPDPSQSGKAAYLTPPVGGVRAAPIGAPGSALPRSRGTSRSNAPAEPEKKPGTVPF